ncbi:MAG: hypothetical protein KIG36_01840 [Eubacteriales bacterium]|nr:hypothetical protein [Eubacteriales bacterium]
MNFKIGKLQVKKRFILFLVAALILICVTVSVCVNAAVKAEIYWGVLNDAEFFSGVVIRDETFYPYGEYGRLDRAAREGDVVCAGALIAELYSPDYIASKLDDLASQRRNIVNYQRNIMKTVNDEELKRVEGEIATLRSRLASAALNGQNESTVTAGAELEALLARQNELLRLKAKADEHLTTLYTLEAALEKTVSVWKSELTAQRDGILSYQSDGLEKTLNVQDISSLSVAEIFSVLNMKNRSSGEEGYRIVNTEKWYIALVCAKNPNLILGDRYDLYRRGSAVPVSGQYISETHDGGKTICLFECAGEMGGLIDARTAMFFIGGSVEGLIVPTSAVFTVNGLKAIQVDNKGKRETVYVKVIASSGEQTVVRPMPDATEPYIGQKVYR